MGNDWNRGINPDYRPRLQSSRLQTREGVGTIHGPEIVERRHIWMACLLKPQDVSDSRPWSDLETIAESEVCGGEVAALRSLRDEMWAMLDRLGSPSREG